MSQLIMDEVSATTLPFLDRLLSNEDKMSSILEQTSGSALLRLTLAAVSRNIIHGGGGIKKAYSIANLLEVNIEENLSGNSEAVTLSVGKLSEEEQRKLLMLSITRYGLYDQPTIMGVA